MSSDLTDLLMNLVAIDSTNPDLVPDGKGEGEISAFIHRWMQERGIEAIREEFTPGRFNVVARVRGTGGGKTLLLNAHMDVVGTAGMMEPFAPRVEQGRLYGRGAYDMKGGLAACMMAMVHARDLQLSGDVILIAVADEEYASIGMQHALQTLRADAAIVTEPTELQLCIAHKGFTWHEVSTTGKAAHGSRPDLGVDAIAHMGRVLGKVEQWQRDLQSRPAHPLLGQGSVHASLIQGGQELSSYPETCTLHLERRTLPHETPDQVEAEWTTLLTDLQNQDPNFNVTHRTTLYRSGFEVPMDSEIVQVLRHEAAQVLGQQPQTVGMTFWMESALLQQAGIPTVVFGPAGTGAHATEEWVDLRSVEQCCETLTRTIQAFCQHPRSGNRAMENPRFCFADRTLNFSPVPHPEVLDFHGKLPGYAPTPLVEAPGIARVLGVNQVWIKDEQDRLGMPAYKILGASWATFRELETRSGPFDPWDTLDDLAAQLKVHLPLTMVAATDGNHGRAVARMARWLGLQAKILVPGDMVLARREAIQQEGAELQVVQGSYDEAVEAAAQLADERHLVISDTSWNGYTRVPDWVVEGYSTIFQEVDQQLAEASSRSPDLVIAQMGVGSLASAVIQHHCTAGRATRVVGVEPLSADCVLQSLLRGQPTEVSGPHTSIMAGLNCGNVSPLAWPYLQGGLSAAVAVPDDLTREAMRLLAADGMVSGESGAAGVAGLLALLTGPDAALRRERLGIAEDSVLLAVSTEGATDPGAYQRIVSTR